MAVIRLNPHYIRWERAYYSPRMGAKHIVGYISLLTGREYVTISRI